MALSLSTLTTGTGSGLSSYTTATFTAPSSGDLLIVGYASGSARDATISDSSGSGSWVSLSDASSTAFATRWWYKIANGSETSVSFSLIGGTSAVDWFVVKVSGWTGTPTLEGTVGEDESNMSTAATSTVGAGSTTNTTANALVLAFFSADQPNLIDAGRSVSDGTSYTEQTAGSGDGQVFLYYRTVSSTGTYTPVYSFSDTGDQAYGSVAVFGDVTGGGSLNVSATTDALTLAEYAATIGKSLNVSATTDALTLAEYAATVSLSRDISATTDALTLAEYPATIGLALNIAATTDALTLTEYAATLGSVTNVQATTDALTLAEYPATIGLALTVSATTDSLTLVEYGATIGDGSVAPAAATGGVGHGRKRKKRRVMVDGYVYVVDPEQERVLLARLAAEKAQEAQLLEALGDPQTAAVARRKAFRIARRADMADPYERIRKDDEEVISRFIGLLAA